MSDTTENTAPETPETPADGTSLPPSDEEAETTSTDADGTSLPPADDDVTKPGQPVVVNDENGQYVLVPQEDGTVKTVVTRQHTLPISNAEQAVFEETHTGDQPRYSLVPGDAGYSALSDPAIPDSHLAHRVEQEILSFAERVIQDPKAVISPIWNSLKGVFSEELDTAIKTGETAAKVAL